MKVFIKENWFKIGVLFFLAIVTFSAAWYYLTFKPQQDEAALQHEVAAHSEAQAQQAAQDQQTQAQAAAKEQQFINCVDAAHQDYVRQGQFDCENAGYTQTQIDNKQCLLSHSVSQALLQDQNDAETLCATLYK